MVHLTSSMLCSLSNLQNKIHKIIIYCKWRKDISGHSTYWAPWKLSEWTEWVLSPYEQFDIPANMFGPKLSGYACISRRTRTPRESWPKTWQLVLVLAASTNNGTKEKKKNRKHIVHTPFYDGKRGTFSKKKTAQSVSKRTHSEHLLYVLFSLSFWNGVRRLAYTATIHEFIGIPVKNIYICETYSGYFHE